MIERQSGLFQLKNNPQYSLCVEVTMDFADIQLNKLTALPGEIDGNERILNLRTYDSKKRKNNKVRIFIYQDWQEICRKNLNRRELEEALERIALFNAPIDGQLLLMQREASGKWGRIIRAFWAWLLNRGLRDTWQWLHEDDKDEESSGSKLRQGIARFFNALKLASHAGEVRTLKYELNIGELKKKQDIPFFLEGIRKGSKIVGVKRFTYGRLANPWRQLQEIQITRFDGLLHLMSNKPVLSLDLNHLANLGIPLLHIKKQQDLPTALSEMVSLAAYYLRLMIFIHLWSFRKPDDPRNYKVDQLPGDIPDIAVKPEYIWIQVDEMAKDRLKRLSKDQLEKFSKQDKVHIRLTRYARPDSDKPPLLMLHGYSLSGTCFAHHAIKPNMASYFWNRKRDVWVLDLRTSCGLDSAEFPWTFEEVALNDIPAAVERICKETGHKTIDVLAHCMGVVMFSMAVLSAKKQYKEIVRSPENDSTTKFNTARKRLPKRINKLAMSQVGPLVRFSPENTFRAFVWGYLEQYLDFSEYKYRLDSEPTLGDELLDRVLSTLPYPDEDLRIENPAWPPCSDTAFVGTRHRVDALFGRDMSLKNIPAKTLQFIDDIFGPLSIKTITQGIHFARLQCIASRQGRNVFVTRENFEQCWNFPAFSIHGEENGLADVATLQRMQDQMLQFGRQYSYKMIKNYGHVDCLIGEYADKDVFLHIEKFFNESAPQASKETDKSNPMPLLAKTPWSGPILERLGDGKLSIRFGCTPGLPNPEYVVFIPVAMVKRKKPSSEKSSVAYNAKKQFRFDDLLIIKAPEHSEYSWFDENGWIKMDLPVANSQGVHFEAVLVFCLYDQPSGLDSAMVESQKLLDFIEKDDINQLPQDYVDKLTSSSKKDRFDRHSAIELLASYVRYLNKEKEKNKNEFGENILIADSLFQVFFSFWERLEKGLIEIPSENSTPEEAVNFALASCQFPGSFWDKFPAYRSYTRLNNVIEEGPNSPDFLVLAGDQVYVDDTAGLFDPTNKDDRYIKAYETLFHNRKVRKILRRIPSFMLLDDHEIENNWEPDNALGLQHSEEQHRLFYQEGVQAYHTYQRGSNINKHLWYTFRAHSLDFFMLDTRTERQFRDAYTSSEAHMIEKDQREAIEKWLENCQLENPQKPVFLVCPSLIFPRHMLPSNGDSSLQGLRSDGWDGYPASMHWLLAFIVDQQLNNIVFLSGDEHLPHEAEITLTNISKNKEVKIKSIHASPLYAPYPFANGIAEDLNATEEYTFAYDRQEYICNTQIDFDLGKKLSSSVSRDGFAIITVRKNTGGWEINTDWSNYFPKK